MKLNKIIEKEQVKSVKVLHDLHVHSEYSYDSEEALHNYFEIASKNNQTYFITTEHIEYMFIGTNCDWTVDYDKMIEELNKLQKEFPNITPLLGIEVGYHKENIEKMNKTINSRNFDQVIMSVHDSGEVDYYYADVALKLGENEFLTLYFNNVLEAVKTFDNYDILGHFDYGFKSAYKAFANVKLQNYQNIVEEIFKELIKKDKTLEINTKVQSALNDEHLRYFLTLYKNLGGKNITLASDSHEKKNYKYQFEHYLQIIKELGFNKLSYFINRQRFDYYI